MQLQTIPRAYVNLSLQAARVPVTLAELLGGHNGDTAWPPSLAFESIEANVRQVAGSLLNDDVMTEQGRLLAAKVAELREAIRLEAEADQRRIAADRAFEERQRDDAEKREQAAERASAQRAAAGRREEQEKSRAVGEAEERAQRASDRAAKRQKDLETQERNARAESVATQRAAVRRKKAATYAAADVVDLDKKISRSKATRTRG